jgi:hypothetical protein
LGPGIPALVDGGAYWDGAGAGSLDGAGPPSMDDIDMLLLALPVRAIEPSAGSSRPLGNADEGPTETGGGLGGGRL